jgi:hypothetical protein
MSINNNYYNLYSSAVNSAKRFISPETIDRIEKNLSFFAATILATISAPAIAYLSNPTRTDADLPCLPEDGPESIFSTKSVIAIGVGAYVMYKAIQIGKSVDERFKKFINPYKDRLIREKIEEMETASKSNKQSALVFRPSSDSIGALILQHSEIPHLQKSTKNHALKVLFCSTGAQLREQIDADTTKYHKVIFRTHANSSDLWLGESIVLTKNSSKMLTWLRNHIEDDAIISIEGCCAAEGEENIARDISRACPQARVYASQKDTTPYDTTTYDEQGIPRFSDKLKSTTRAYQNGAEIAVPTDSLYKAFMRMFHV